MRKLLIGLALCLALLASGGMIGYGLGGQQEIENLRDQVAYYQREQARTYDWLSSQLWVLEQNYLRAAYKPPVKEYVYVEVVEERPVYISVDKLVEVETEKIVVRYIQPEYFNNLQEVENFLEYWRANKRIVFTSGQMIDGVVSNNCKEMAEQLSEMAAEQGYRFPTETLTPQDMYRIYGEWPDRPHRVNKAWIPGVGEWYYDYETDKLWKVW